MLKSLVSSIDLEFSNSFLRFVSKHIDGEFLDFDNI